MENQFHNLKSQFNSNNNRFISLKDYKAHYDYRILPQISKYSFINPIEYNSKFSILADSKEDFIKNPHVTSKSFNFRKSDTVFKEFEAKTLLNFYNFDGRKENVENEDSKEVFNKLKQFSGLNNEEKQNISRNLKSFDIVLNKNQISKGICINSYVHDKEVFQSPFKSLSQLKVNKNIYSNVINLYTNRLQESYILTLNKYISSEEKQRNMPGVRVSLSETAKLKQQQLQEAISQNKLGEKKEEITNINKVNLSATSDKYLPEFQGEYISDQRNKPRARAFASMNIVKDNLYLFGGLSETKLNDFWICEIKNNYNWKQIQPKGKEPIGRFGHTSVFYDKCLFIYGGGLKKNAALPNEGQELLIYNIRKNTLYYESCGNKSEVKWRRSHIAECIGSYMIIHGGIDDEDEKILNDSYILDLNNLNWTKSDLKGKSYFLAYHASTLVVQSEKRTHPQVNAYKFPEILTIKSSSKKMKLEGIYIFGGLDHNRKPKNELKILRLGKKPLEWFTPKTQGTPPEERISCNITYYEELNFILINGGRNDVVKNIFYHDIFLLNLHSFNWIKVNTFSSQPKERAQHCSVIFNNKLIIFGGICATKYLGSDLFVVNFDISNKRSKFNFSSKEICKEVEEYQENITNDKRRKSLLKNNEEKRRKSSIKEEEEEKKRNSSDEFNQNESEKEIIINSKHNRSEKHLEKIRKLSKLKDSVLKIVNKFK